MFDVHPIKVAMTGLPQMLTEVLKAFLESQGDIEVEVGDRDSEPAELARASNADVVIVAGGPGLAYSLGALFERLHGIVVLAISANGREASRFRLVGEQVKLPDASPQDIVDTIRGVNERRPFDEWESNG